jgi:N-formylglutamate amidohydrolase
MQCAAVSEYQVAGARLPVLVSVPHAGRHLPEWIAAEARIPLMELDRLSDAWSDLIAAPLFAAGARVIKANLQRAVADCNRHESDMDGIDVAPALRFRFGPPGRKARAGLGVVPTRLAGCGQLWRRPIAADAFEDRLNLAHRPFHKALLAARDAMVAEHGFLLIIDLHSMPSLPRGTNPLVPAQIIVGDRHGTSAANAVAHQLVRDAEVHTMPAALNNPYPGGHIVESYARPHRGIHAIQVEFDRALYLDTEMKPDADRALALGEWLLSATLRVLPLIHTSADWPQAAE